MTGGAMGFVYCIGSAPGGPVKVGYSANPEKRLAAISTSQFEPVRILGVLPGDMALEAALHLEFAALRLRNEWFMDRDLAISSRFPAYQSARAILEPTATAFKRFIVTAEPRLTHEEWAARFGISRSHLTELANGTGMPSRKLIERINAVTQGKVPPNAWFESEAA